MQTELELFKQDVNEAKGKCMALPVGGAFHSPFMNEASRRFGEFLKDVKVDKPTVTVYSNATAKPYGNDVKALLEKQINSPVRWDTIITDMVSSGFDTFVEMGAGNTLQKLIKRIAPEVNAYSVDNYESALSLSKELENA